jgi:hypothetical protein
LLLDAGAAACDDLRLFLIVPKAWGERLLLELQYLGLAFWNVKDAPLASSGAVGGQQWYRASRSASTGLTV